MVAGVNINTKKAYDNTYVTNVARNLSSSAPFALRHSLDKKGLKGISVLFIALCENRERIRTWFI